MIYRAVILVSLTAAILFVGGLTTYPSPLVERSRPMAKTDDPSFSRRVGTANPCRVRAIRRSRPRGIRSGQGTRHVEAFELFIARHPNHALVAEARREIERLKGVR